MRPVLIAVFLLVGMAAGVAAPRWWQPLQQVSQQAFVAASGDSVPQYQWRYVVDRTHPEVCVLILTHEVTGAFAITAVPAEGCR